MPEKQKEWSLVIIMRNGFWIGPVYLSDIDWEERRILISEHGNYPIWLEYMQTADRRAESAMSAQDLCETFIEGMYPQQSKNNEKDPNEPVRNVYRRQYTKLNWNQR